jgi:hypothetical protein
MGDLIDLSKVKPLDDIAAKKDKALLDTLTKPFNAEREKLIKKALTKPEQLSFLPTKLCRTTIFFPLPRRGRKKLQSEPITLTFKTEWGTIEYEGRRLSVDDEDLLLVCTYLAKKEGERCFDTTFTELQKLLGIIPNSKLNPRIREAFERLGKVTFTIDYNVKGGMWSVSHIMRMRCLKGKLQVTFDKDFYDEVLKSYTLLSIPFRRRLNGDIAKLLFTFLSSHRTPATYFTDTLATALNMNQTREKKYTVRALKKGFKELQTRGFLIHSAYDKKRDLFTITPIEKKRWKKLK